MTPSKLLRDCGRGELGATAVFAGLLFGFLMWELSLSRGRGEPPLEAMPHDGE
jgi:hypothetical protein